jgi:FAD/FMN-containing dehydrogenase
MPRRSLWTTTTRRSARRQTARMSIEMRAAEVHALAASLRRSSDDAEQIGVRLAGDRSGGGDLQPAIEAFLETQRMTGRVLAGELQWLGATIAGVADSWLRLDGALLRPHGRMRPE